MPLPLEPDGGPKVVLTDYNALLTLVNALEQRVGAAEVAIENGIPGGGTGDVTQAELDAAVASLQADIATKRPSARRVVFPIRYVAGAWEYATLAAAQAAGMGADDTGLFIGNPGGAPPAWFRNDIDAWTEGG